MEWLRDTPRVMQEALDRTERDVEYGLTSMLKYDEVPGWRDLFYTDLLRLRLSIYNLFRKFGII